ncbi:MAG: efflux RND transporter permease subunit, partial [Candidatus Omnitrophica bacterium]|nr:efflux RND transporter permease subunit [Candidatus Omnitrophota bacterium]
NGEFIQKAINELRKSLIYGTVLAILILLLFLRKISAIVILSLSLPFSVLITFSFMRIFGISLNVITLAGLCLGVGMLVDSSIVVMENIFTHQEKKSQPLTRREIATKTNEMSLALIASTITTIIVFLPFFFINKETQKIYGGLALSITFSLLASIFIALSLVPVLIDMILKKKSGVKTTLFSKIQNIYKKSLNFIIGFRYIVIGITILGVFVTISLATLLEKEFIGVPEEDKFTVFIQLPTGTRIDITDKIVKKVEYLLEGLRKNRIVKNYTADIEPYSAKIYVQLTSVKERSLPTSKIIEKLREQTSLLEPAFIYYEEPQEIESKEFIIEIVGYDYEILKDLARETASYLQTIQGLTDVKIRMREGGPQLDIVLDQNKLALYGLNTEVVATELHGKLRGLIPTRLRPKEETFITIRKSGREKDQPLSLFAKEAKEIELITRIPEKYRKKFKDLEELTFIVGDKEIKLSQISQLKFNLAPSEIWRKNKKRMVQVSANKGNLPLGRVAQEISLRLKNMKLPEGYSWNFGESYKKMLLNQKELRLSFILALILVYMVMASLFENIFQPFIMFATIPLAGIGSITLLYLKKQAVGIGVLIGGIMLAGIVVNNGIILVDSINRLRRREFSLETAVVEASVLRLRPILMTTLTTILPLIPLLIFKSDASPLWSPLALTVVSGLATSCLLTLYVIPCVYLVFHK